jgi:hypothetical protein
MCAQNMRELLTPPGAETFIFPSFSRHIEKPLDLQLSIVLKKFKSLVFGSAVLDQIAKSGFPISLLEYIKLCESHTRRKTGSESHGFCHVFQPRRE